jgi:hypothetical protein
MPETFLNIEEITQLIETGMIELTDDLMLRLEFNPNIESYEDSDWYNDPNNVMSRHHY